MRIDARVARGEALPKGPGSGRRPTRGTARLFDQAECKTLAALEFLWGGPFGACMRPCWGLGAGQGASSGEFEVARIPALAVDSLAQWARVCAMQNPWIRLGAAWAGLAVALGAFGAHGLEGRTDDPKALEWWQTAADYHFGHGLALLLFGLAVHGGAIRSSWVGRLFLVGSVIFSGTLYAMALGAPRWFGAITPIGGTALIAGWVVFAVRAGQARTQDSQ